MSRITAPEHIPTVKLYKIGATELRRKLVRAWNWEALDIEDRWYFHPVWKDWDKIFQHVQKNLPKYVPDKFDCDNFSHYISVMVARDFGSNVCGRIEGDMNEGRHKWNIFFDGDDFYQLESQRYTPPNQIADLDDPNYVPKELGIG